MHISRITKKSKISFPRTENYRFTNHGKNKSSITLHAKQKCPFEFTRHEKSIGDPLTQNLCKTSKWGIATIKGWKNVANSKHAILIRSLYATRTSGSTPSPPSPLPLPPMLWNGCRPFAFHQSSLFHLCNMAALAKIYLVFYNVTLTLG